MAWRGFDVVRYDNLKSAVARVFKGRRRVESDRFVALRSHYRFESSFCLPGVQGAHEKGGVEGDIGRFRRRHLVPVPEVGRSRSSTSCSRRRVSRPRSHGHRPGRDCRCSGATGSGCSGRLPGAAPDLGGGDTAGRLKGAGDGPHEPVLGSGILAGLRIRARVGAGEISFWHDGKQVARHERLHDHHQISAKLDHYLDLLTRKPGALARSLALRQERDRGDWPACFDELWTAIQARSGRQEAARQMIEVLLLCREHDAEQVELAVRGALAAGAHDGRAVKLLVDRAARPQPPAFEIDARLAAIGSPPPTDDISAYDQLRDTEAGR